MIDQEKVLKGLECCSQMTGEVCRKCPYVDEWEEGEGACTAHLAANALTLLRKQEPVEPVNIRWEMNIRGGTCPKCLNWVQRSYNYCPFCGKAVRWND